MFAYIQTLWLFTSNDHQTTVYPWIAFGIIGALSGSALTTNQSPDFWTIISRLPQTFLWMWLNTLAFTVANRRLPSSVIEDAINKPWRPLPSGRITIDQARHLLLTIIPTLFILTLYVGGTEFALVGLVLNWMHNDLGGADDSYIVRNLINALGLVCWTAGTISVACGGEHTLNLMGRRWLAIEGAVIFTTLHVQDLRDEAGDRARGRKTAPIVLGSAVTRWTIALAVLFWSFLCPTIWALSIYGFGMPVILGTVLAFRVLFLTSVEADKMTWKLWALWISSLFVLPLCANPGVFNYFVVG